MNKGTGGRLSEETKGREENLSGETEGRRNVREEEWREGRTFERRNGGKEERKTREANQ